MDAETLKRKIDAARTFEQSAGGVTLVVRVPSETVMRAAIAQLPESGQRIAQLQHVLMRQCVIDWRGVRPCDLLPEAPEVELAFDATLLDDVFDRWPALYDAAYIALMSRYNSRVQWLEDERKNSSTMSVP